MLEGAHNYLVTFTGLGEEPGHLRVDPTSGKNPDGTKHYLRVKGDRPRRACGCELTHSVSMGQWNAKSSKAWNRAATYLRRRYPDADLEFMRFVEPQKRGALHLHVLIRSRVKLDAHRLQKIAVQAGFGCAIDVQGISSERAARYASKYAAKGASQRSQVPWVAPHKVVVEPGWVDPHTGEIHADITEVVVGPCPPTYRNVSQSKKWGLTMNQVRAAIRESAQRREALEVLAVNAGEHVGAAVSGQVLESVGVACPP